MTLFVFCALFLLAASSAAAAPAEEKFLRPASSPEHNIQCTIEGQDTWQWMDDEIVSAQGKYLQIIERNVTYPRNGPGKETITCVRIYDAVENEEGGYPEIINGGIGFHEVTIRFVSQKSKGFEFYVEVYGLP